MDANTRTLAREGSLPLGVAYRAGLLSPRVVGLLRVAGDEELGIERVALNRDRMHHALPEREQRLWACDCAERALLREREAGREPDPRSWEAVRVSRLYADGLATAKELAAARDAARAAARAAAKVAARDAAWAAARAAAKVAAWAAARDAAAWDAAWDAAWGAASAAARDAAWDAAAWDAAWDAERDWQEERLRHWAGKAARRLHGR